MCFYLANCTLFVEQKKKELPYKGMTLGYFELLPGGERENLQHGTAQFLQRALRTFLVVAPRGGAQHAVAQHDAVRLEVPEGSVHEERANFTGLVLGWLAGW